VLRRVAHHCFEGNAGETIAEKALSTLETDLIMFAYAVAVGDVNHSEIERALIVAYNRCSAAIELSAYFRQVEQNSGKPVAS